MTRNTANSGRTGDWTAIAGIIPDRRLADEVARHLSEAGFLPDEMVVLGKDEVGAAAADGRLGLPKPLEAGEQRSYTAWNTLSGALLALLLGAEVVALAGFAGLIAVSVLAEGAAIGAVTGAVFGDALAGSDISEAATVLREQISAGRILIAAHARGAAKAKQARAILEAAGATEVRGYRFVTPAIPAG